MGARSQPRAGATRHLSRERRWHDASAAVCVVRARAMPNEASVAQTIFFLLLALALALVLTLPSLSSVGS